MDDIQFSDALALIGSSKEHAAYDEAQKHYRALLKQGLTSNQRAVVSIGRATCFLRALDPDSAADIIEQVSLSGLDHTVQAVLLNVKANAYHHLERYEEAVSAGKEAETIARTLGPSGTDVLGEALSNQGFAEAELGRLTEASEHLAMARKLPIDDSLAQSILLYTEAFNLRCPSVM